MIVSTIAAGFEVNGSRQRIVLFGEAPMIISTMAGLERVALSDLVGRE